MHITHFTWCIEAVESEILTHTNALISLCTVQRVSALSKCNTYNWELPIIMSCRCVISSDTTEKREKWAQFFIFIFIVQYHTLVRRRARRFSGSLAISLKKSRLATVCVLCFRRLKIVCSRARTLLPSSLTIAYVRFNFDSFVTWADGAHRSSVYVRTVLRLLNSCALSHSHKI